MRKSLWGLIGIIVIAGIAVGIYAAVHKSPAKTSNSSTNNSSQTPSSAVNNAVVITKTSSSLGQYLADPSGRALYTYNLDTTGVSNCTGSCLTTWPAYHPTSTIANLPSGISTITRKDNGETQYTYNGMPLYYFTSDTNGQVTGNGVDNFQVAKPSSSSQSSNSSSSNSSSTSSGYSSSGNPY